MCLNVLATCVCVYLHILKVLHVTLFQVVKKKPVDDAPPDETPAEKPKSAPPKKKPAAAVAMAAASGGGAKGKGKGKGKKGGGGGVMEPPDQPEPNIPVSFKSYK